MQKCLNCGIRLALLVKGSDGYCKKCLTSIDTNALKESNSRELESTPIEAERQSNLFIGKSYLGDFGRSLVVFGFYVFIIYASAAVLTLQSSAYRGAAGAIAYVFILGAIVSIAAALIYFGILFFARALDKDYLRKAATVWFFVFPALVLIVMSQL